MTEPLHVGQTIYWLHARDQWQEDTPLVVQRVGRRWATVSGHWRVTQVDKITLEVGDRHGRGCCYRSEAEWQADQVARTARREADEAWDKLRQEIAGKWSRPNDLDAGQITEAMRWLGFVA